ncbi:unnamed protein product, partial [Trichogramma brassicae]
FASPQAILTITISNLSHDASRCRIKKLHYEISIKFVINPRLVASEYYTNGMRATIVIFLRLKTQRNCYFMLLALSLEFVIRRRTIVTRVPSRETAVGKGSRGATRCIAKALPQFSVYSSSRKILTLCARGLYLLLCCADVNTIEEHRFAFILLVIASFYAGSAGKIKFALPLDTGQTKYVRLPVPNLNEKLCMVCARRRNFRIKCGARRAIHVVDEPLSRVSSRDGSCQAATDGSCRAYTHVRAYHFSLNKREHG